MDQSDLDLLQATPTYHLESVIKTRRIPLSLLDSRKGSPAGTATSPSLSPETTLELASHLFNPTSIAVILQDLGEFETAILRELVACGGRANSRDLALYLTCVGQLSPSKKAESVLLDPPQASQLIRPLQPPQYPPAHAHGVFEMALRRLLTFGLVFWGKQTNFAGRDYTNGTPDGVLIIPMVVRAVVQREWQLDADLAEGQSTDIGDGARALQRSLYLYWSLAASMRDGLPLANNGLLARSALRQIVEHMPIPGQKDPVRAESNFPFLLFIRLLLMKLGLLQERNNALYVVPAETFFATPLVERARRCYHLYLDTPFWNEMSYLSEINVRPGPTPLDPAHEEVMRARQAVVERLRHERADVWHDLAAFIAHTKLYVPYLLFPHQFGPRAERYSYGSNPYGWDFRLRRGWLTHREGWHMIEGSFIRAVVGGPLYWLGLVELDREENPSAFRLSSGVDALVSAAPLEASQETWGRIIVQPNFELMALAPVSEALLVKLDRFADRVRLEHIAQYRLTKSSVTRAISHGLHAQDIQEVLEQASGSEIPQNVSYSLDEWERQARRIELWSNATLLEVGDEALLDALFADEETRQFFQRRLSPKMAQMSPGQLPAVQDLLWQRIPILAVSSSTVSISTESHEPQWQLHDDGVLQPCYPVLNLYLVAEAERFCEHDQATSRYKITAASVRRAFEQGITLEYIIHFLQQYCEDDIPAALLIRLKLWGNGYSNEQNIQVERAPLLCLAEEVWHDLIADEELASLLGPEVEQQSRLVRVAPDNLERVIALLRERGFSIE